MTFPDMRYVDMPSVMIAMLPNGQLAFTDEWKLIKTDPGAYRTVHFSVTPNIYSKECKVYMYFNVCVCVCVYVCVCLCVCVCVCVGVCAVLLLPLCREQTGK